MVVESKVRSVWTYICVEYVRGLKPRLLYLNPSIKINPD